MQLLHKTLGVVVMLGLALGASAQQADESAQASDPLFVHSAAQSNIYEIGSSRLAVQNAEGQEVKDFAQKIIDDHTKATSQLIAAVEGLDIRPTADMTQAQQLKVNYLGTLQGPEFEAAYLEQQVLAHEEAVSLFETASSMVQEQQLKTFIDETLPVLQEHLQMAQELMQASGNE
jgi:putative membrane protein